MVGGWVGFDRAAEAFVRSSGTSAAVRQEPDNEHAVFSPHSSFSAPLAVACWAWETRRYQMSSRSLSVNCCASSSQLVAEERNRSSPALANQGLSCARSAAAAAAGCSADELRPGREALSRGGQVW